jgi:hypothetical protein
VAHYLAHGPAFIFLFHPALGPLWEIIAAKVRRGRLAPGAELQLEVAEADVEALEVEGSLLVTASHAMGHWEGEAAAAQQAQHGGSHGNGHAHGHAHPGPDQRLIFSDRCARVRLHNVRVLNRGIDWASPHNVWWRHRVMRHEACRVLLHGASEFEAWNVTLGGELTFEVPDGHRMRVTAGGDGRPHVELERMGEGAGPSWRWEYGLEGGSGRCVLTMCSGCGDADLMGHGPAV